MFYHLNDNANNDDHGNGNDGDDEEDKDAVVDVCHGLCRDRNLPR